MSLGTGQRNNCTTRLGNRDFSSLGRLSRQFKKKNRSKRKFKKRDDAVLRPLAKATNMTLERFKLAGWEAYETTLHRCGDDSMTREQKWIHWARFCYRNSRNQRRYVTTFADNIDLIFLFGKFDPAAGNAQNKFGWMAEEIRHHAHVSARTIQNLWNHYSKGLSRNRNKFKDLECLIPMFNVVMGYENEGYENDIEMYSEAYKITWFDENDGIVDQPSWFRDLSAKFLRDEHNFADGVEFVDEDEDDDESDAESYGSSSSVSSDEEKEEAFVPTSPSWRRKKKAPSKHVHRAPRRSRPRVSNSEIANLSSALSPSGKWKINQMSSRSKRKCQRDKKVVNKRFREIYEEHAPLSDGEMTDEYNPTPLSTIDHIEPLPSIYATSQGYVGQTATKSPSNPVFKKMMEDHMEEFDAEEKEEEQLNEEVKPRDKIKTGGLGELLRQQKKDFDASGLQVNHDEEDVVDIVPPPKPLEDKETEELQEAIFGDDVNENESNDGQSPPTPFIHPKQRKEVHEEKNACIFKSVEKELLKFCGGVQSKLEEFGDLDELIGLVLAREGGRSIDAIEITKLIWVMKYGNDREENSTGRKRKREEDDEETKNELQQPAEKKMKLD